MNCGLFRAAVPPNWGRKTLTGLVKTAFAPSGVPSIYSLRDASVIPAGALLVADAAFQPGGAVAKLDVDTAIPYNDDTPMFNRQSIGASAYDFVAGDWITVTGAADQVTYQFWLKDEPPDETAPIISRTVTTGIPIDPIVVSAGITDFEGDVLVYGGFSCPGLAMGPQTINGQAVIAITGTPTTPGVYTQNLTAMDEPGAITNLTAFTITVSAGITVPTVDDHLTTLAAGGTALTAAGLIVVGNPQLVDTAVPAGIIDHTVPPGGAVVPPGSSVIIYVSADPSPDAVGQSRVNGIALWEAFPATVQITYGSSSLVPRGQVMQQLDANGFAIGAGQLLLPNSLVTLVINTYPQSLLSGSANQSVL